MYRKFRVFFELGEKLLNNYSILYSSNEHLFVFQKKIQNIINNLITQKIADKNPRVTSFSIQLLVLFIKVSQIRNL